jgi:two-component system, response regulator
MSYEPVDILLVEDSQADAEMTMRALKRRNLCNHVMWLKDGVEALDFLLRRNAYAERVPGNPKLVLLDLQMPRMDGIEVLRTIRATPELAMLPVVMLTSSAEEKDVVQSYKLGVNSYVVKPVNFESFSEEVVKTGCYWLLVNRVPTGL